MPVQVIEAGSRTTVIPRAGNRVALPAAANVTVIPQAEQAPHKTRTAYYVRVSTDSEAQQGSNDNMVEHFENLIKNDPTMEYAGGYVDFGESGTQLRTRRAFNQMMEDCRAGLIDRVLTKSISRWARNTLISIQTVRELKALGVSVYFEKENLESMEETSEVIFCLLSSIAQSESQSISSNISLGLHYKFAQGVQIVNCSRFLGYDKDPNTKELVINPAEARVVRFIFRAFLEGFSIPEIGKKLRNAHIPTGSGKYDWPTESIRYMLSNERYMGHAVLQKTVTKDFLSHKSMKNTGQLPQYYLTDCHPAIVPEEVWNLTQRLLIQRGRTEGHPGQRKYALSGKVICGCCGTEYKRFAGARVSTVPLLDVATTPPSQASTEGVDLGAANTLPTPSAVFPTTALPSALLPSPVDTSTGGDVENSSPRNAGAVWKCKARVSRKDAAAAAARLFSTTTNPSSVTPAADQASTPGSVATSTAGDGETIPTPSRDGLIWRCDNKIIGEEQLVMAVDRALALLPREEANIRLIQQECLRVLALSTSANATLSSPSAACGEHSGTGSGQEDAHTAAQILLLHTETALDFLSGSTSSQWVGSSGAGMIGGPVISRDGGRAASLPCTTFQQFVERSSASLSSMLRTDDDAIDLLIERVVIDGEKIKVVFKAGVEI